MLKFCIILGTVVITSTNATAQNIKSLPAIQGGLFPQREFFDFDATKELDKQQKIKNCKWVEVSRTPGECHGSVNRNLEYRCYHNGDT